MKVSSEIEIAEAALGRGDYSQCLNILDSLSQKFPTTSHEGAKIRMLMATAWMGKGDDKKAIDSCRLLIKSNDPEIRQQAKQLVTILEAPNLPRPEKWSLKIPTIDLEPSKGISSLNNFKTRKKPVIEEHPPTGPTKALDIIFLFIVLLVVGSLTFFLST